MRKIVAGLLGFQELEATLHDEPKQALAGARVPSWRWHDGRVEGARTRVIYRAVLATTAAAFAASLLWYSPLLFGRIWTATSGASVGSTPAWTFLVAPLRELAVALVLAHLIARLRLFNLKGAIGFALALWTAFFAVQMTGAILWDHRPIMLTAVHAGDWLMKMLIMSIMLSAWHGKRYVQQRG